MSKGKGTPGPRVDKEGRNTADFAASLGLAKGVSASTPRLGFFAILHTWGQTLIHHPHVHCVLGQPEHTHVEREFGRGENNEPFLELLPQSLRLCPHCGRGPMRCIEVLGRPPPSHHRSRRVAA